MKKILVSALLFAVSAVMAAPAFAGDLQCAGGKICKVNFVPKNRHPVDAPSTKAA